MTGLNQSKRTSVLALLCLAALVLLLGCNEAPEETPVSEGWPGMTGTPVLQEDALGARLQIRAESIDESRTLLRFIGEVVGGPDNNRELYCSDVRWDFGDGRRERAVPGCPPWTEESEIGRRSERVHRYHEDASYDVLFGRGPLETRITIQVPLDAP